MTVVVIGTVVDVTGRKDSREWRAWSPVYREGTGGAVVTYREQDVQVVAGSLTARLEPGPCFVQNPDGDRWLVTVPDADTELWPLIAAAVAIPPGTPVDELNAAVAAYFDANPIPTGPEGPPNVLEIGTVVSGATAGATITGTSPAQVLNLTLPKGDTGDTGPTADWSTISGKPAVVAAGADAAAARGVISAQAADSDLTAIAGLSPANDDVVQRKSGAWTNRTPAQLKTDLALVKGDVGLGNADNTSDANKPISTATQTALNTKQATSEKNQANGYAGLDSEGLVPAALLPSYVDDVLEYANTGAFPATGEAGKIYTATSTGKIYRWGGSAYAEISPSPGSTDAVPEGATNLYYTSTRADARIAAALGASVQAYSSILASIAALTGAADNDIVQKKSGAWTNRTPAQVKTDLALVKADVGLGSVDNTADSAKAVLSATKLTTARTINGVSFDGTGNITFPTGSTTTYGAWGSRPSAAGNAGSVYVVTETGDRWLSDGSVWNLIGLGTGPLLPAPSVASNWTWSNQGSATLTDSYGGLLLTCPSVSGQYRFVTIAVPAAPYTLTVELEPQISQLLNSWYQWGLVLADNSNKFLINRLGCSNADTTQIAVEYWSSPTSKSSSTVLSALHNTSGEFDPAMPRFMRITDDNTNHYMGYSYNGIDWFKSAGAGRTSFVTPTRIGFGVYNATGANTTLRVRGWQVS